VDRKYVEELFKKHYKATVNYLNRLNCVTPNEDLVQDVFVMMISLEKDIPLQYPKSFICHCAKNKLLDYLKKPSSNETSINGSMDQGELEQRFNFGEIRHEITVFRGASTEEVVMYRDELKQIAKKIKKLPFRRRTIFCLFTFNNLSLIQIAEIIGTDKGNVEKGIYRARQQLGIPVGKEKRKQSGRHLFTPGHRKFFKHKQLGQLQADYPLLV